MDLNEEMIVTTVRTVHRTSTSESDHRVGRWPTPRAVRATLAGVLGFGVALHVTAILAGRPWLLAHVLTPAVDVALTGPMAFSSWGLWRLRRQVHHAGPSHRVAYTVLATYMAVSALVHLDTLVAWEVRYVERFPAWYSAAIVPVQSAMLLFVLRLRFAAAPAVDPRGAVSRDATVAVPGPTAGREPRIVTAASDPQPTPGPSALPASISDTITIAATAERVWTHTIDVERLPAITPTIRGVERLDRGPLRVGSRVRLRQRGLPWLTWTIEEIDPPRRFAWATRLLGVRMVAVHHVDRLPDDRCRLTLGVRFEGPGSTALELLGRRAIGRALAAENAGFAGAASSDVRAAPEP